MAREMPVPAKDSKVKQVQEESAEEIIQRLQSENRELKKHLYKAQSLLTQIFNEKIRNAMGFDFLDKAISKLSENPQEKVQENLQKKKQLTEQNASEDPFDALTVRSKGYKYQVNDHVEE